MKTLLSVISLAAVLALAARADDMKPAPMSAQPAQGAASGDTSSMQGSMQQGAAPDDTMQGGAMGAKPDDSMQGGAMQHGSMQDGAMHDDTSPSSGDSRPGH